MINYTNSTFSESCSLITGNSINEQEKKQKFLNLKIGLPYIATKDISFHGVIDYLNGVKIPPHEYGNFKKAFAESTFICIEGGSAGKKIAFSDHECFFVNKLLNVSSKNNQFLKQKYLFYFIKSAYFKTQFKDALKGIIGGVSMKKIANFHIHYPEDTVIQNSISRVLDQSNTRTQKILGNINKVELNLDNAFHQILEKTIFRSEYDFSEAPLEKLLKKQLQNGHSPVASKIDNGGLRVLTLSAVTGFEFKKNEVKFSESFIKNHKKYLLNKGDLLLSRGNARKLVGHCAIVDDLESETIFSDLMIRVLPNEEIISSRYLYYFLQTPTMRAHIEKIAKGANPSMVKINQTQVKEFLIVYPSLKIQEEIINYLDKINLSIQKLKKLYKKKYELIENSHYAHINKLISHE